MTKYKSVNYNEDNNSYSLCNDVNELFEYNKMYGSIDRLEYLYFGIFGDVGEGLIDVLISSELKKENKIDRKKFKMLIIGYKNDDSSCITFKNINMFLSDNDEKYQQDDKQKRIQLVYGYVHKFETDKSVIINNSYYIPNEIINFIVTYYGFYGLLFCCYDKKTVDFESKKERNIYQWTHIHDTDDILYKLLHFFEAYHGVIY
eukprot:157631_1